MRPRFKAAVGRPTPLLVLAALYASGGVAVNDRIALSRDRVKIVIAQGGNATVGSFTIIVDDGK